MAVLMWYYTVRVDENWLTDANPSAFLDVCGFASLVSRRCVRIK